MAEQAWRPRPVFTHTGGPGRPGFPSALKTKGCLRKEAGTVRMKGGESRPDHGGRKSPGSDPTRRSRGGRRHSGAPGGGVPARHVGAFTKVPDYEVAPIGAPLPHVCEGKGNDGGPHADQTTGTMNHVCLLLENFARKRGL